MGVTAYRSRSTVYFVDLGIYPTIDFLYKASKVHFFLHSVKTFLTKGHGKEVDPLLVPVYEQFFFF